MIQYTIAVMTNMMMITNILIMMRPVPDLQGIK